MGTKYSVVAGLAIALLSASPAAFAQARGTYPIAYISVQRILAEAEDAKTAAKELETLRAVREQELKAKKRELDDTKLQIANAGGMFSGSKRQQLTELAKRQESELQQATQKAQTDFQELQKKVQDRLRKELGTIISALAQQRGVAYVLNQDAAVVLAPSAANWTDEVLQRLNAAEKGPSEKTTTEQTPASKSAPKKP
jgi:Skp family chaperone for outer membrane proteins